MEEEKAHLGALILEKDNISIMVRTRTINEALDMVGYYKTGIEERLGISIEDTMTQALYILSSHSVRDSIVSRIKSLPKGVVYYVDLDENMRKYVVSHAPKGKSIIAIDPQMKTSNTLLDYITGKEKRI